MSTITLEIEGMSCGHCVKAVRDALAEVPEVSVERVDIGSANVSTAGAPTPEVAGRLVEALRDAGYEGRVADGPAGAS